MTRTGEQLDGKSVEQGRASREEHQGCKEHEGHVEHKETQASREIAPIRVENILMRSPPCPRVPGPLMFRGTYVAACCNFNPWKTSATMIEEIRRYNAYEKTKTPLQDKIENLCLDELRGIVTSAKIQDVSPADSVEALRRTLMREIMMEVSTCAKTNSKCARKFGILDADVEQETSMKRGRDREKTSLDRMEKRKHTKITQRNSKVLTLVIDGLFFIRCMVDGISEDGLVVESKSRRNRLFRHIPVYERVQLELYMKCTRTKSIYHVEEYEGNSIETTYVHSEKLWKEIKANLHAFKRKFDDTTGFRHVCVACGSDNTQLTMPSVHLKAATDCRHFFCIGCLEKCNATGKWCPRCCNATPQRGLATSQQFVVPKLTTGV